MTLTPTGCTITLAKSIPLSYARRLYTAGNGRQSQTAVSVAGYVAGVSSCRGSNCQSRPQDLQTANSGQVKSQHTLADDPAVIRSPSQHTHSSSHGHKGRETSHAIQDRRREDLERHGQQRERHQPESFQKEDMDSRVTKRMHGVQLGFGLRYDATAEVLSVKKEAEEVAADRQRYKLRMKHWRRNQDSTPSWREHKAWWDIGGGGVDEAISTTSRTPRILHGLEETNRANSLDGAKGSDRLGQVEGSWQVTRRSPGEVLSPTQSWWERYGLQPGGQRAENPRNQMDRNRYGNVHGDSRGGGAWWRAAPSTTTAAAAATTTTPAAAIVPDTRQTWEKYRSREYHYTGRHEGHAVNRQEDWRLPSSSPSEDWRWLPTNADRDKYNFRPTVGSTREPRVTPGRGQRQSGGSDPWTYQGQRSARFPGHRDHHRNAQHTYGAANREHLDVRAAQPYFGDSRRQRGHSDAPPKGVIDFGLRYQDNAQVLDVSDDTQRWADHGQGRQPQHGDSKRRKQNTWVSGNRGDDVSQQWSPHLPQQARYGNPYGDYRSADRYGQYSHAGPSQPQYSQYGRWQPISGGGYYRRRQGHYQQRYEASPPPFNRGRYWADWQRRSHQQLDYRGEHSGPPRGRSSQYASSGHLQQHHRRGYFGETGARVPKFNVGGHVPARGGYSERRVLVSNGFVPDRQRAIPDPNEDVLGAGRTVPPVPVPELEQSRYVSEINQRAADISGTDRRVFWGGEAHSTEG